MRTSPTRRARRRHRLLAVALAVSGAVGLVSAVPVMVAGDEPETRSAAPMNSSCRGIWDQIPVLAIPEQAWPSVAEFLGFAQDGQWLSADGLTWEHFNGQVVTVARPRTPHGHLPVASCTTRVADTGWSRS